MERSTPFVNFATVADHIAATTKRLEKAALLAEYFDKLPDSDLVHAARYFAGYAFSLRDQRTTNIGGSALMSAIHAVTECDPDWMSQALVARGDIGEMAEEAFQKAGINTGPQLALSDVADAFTELAQTSGTKNKAALVFNLLKVAAPVEAKYLIKLFLSDLRIGLQEGAVEDAIARWTKNDTSRIQWVNMLTGDIGETALLARLGQLDQAQMSLFHPLKFMLATPAADLNDIKRQMPEQFDVEDKFDGIRAQVHIAFDIPDAGPLHGVVADGIRVALFSRTLDEITVSFPDLVEPLAKLLEPLHQDTEPPLAPPWRGCPRIKGQV